MRRTILPGLIVLVVIGLVGYGLSTTIPEVNVLIITILLGIIIGNTYGIPDWAHPGVSTHSLWLEVGIVVMGARVALGQVLDASSMLIMLILGTVLVTIITVEFLARFVYSIPEEIGSLLAAGSSICGVSAVVAVAESIHVNRDDIAYAATTILIFDAITLFVYPLIGHALHLSDTVFGIWAGLTMFSTGPVTAAGFSFSNTAGELALIVKLSRNSLIGIVAILYAVYYRRRGGKTTTTENEADGIWDALQSLWESFPKFILGFFALMILANIGVLNQKQVSSLSNVSDWAFLLAFAGLGLEFQIGKLRETGYKPVLTVLTMLLVLSTVILFLVRTLF